MRKIHLLLLALVFMVGGLAIIIAWGRKTVTLVENGERRSLVTYALTPSQFLEFAGVILREGDRLSPEDQSWLHDGDVLLLDRASQIVIQSDQGVQTLLTPERIPANLLALAEV